MLGTDKALKGAIIVKNGEEDWVYTFEYSEVEEGYVGHLDSAKGCFIYGNTYSGLKQSLHRYLDTLIVNECL